MCTHTHARHKLQVIYETDDDNVLIEANLAQSAFHVAPQSTTASASVMARVYKPVRARGGKTINFYGIVCAYYAFINTTSTHTHTHTHTGHFGNFDVWPRGFSLGSVNSGIREAEPAAPVRMLIQQGLASKDPDVDAIFRLTRRKEELQVL
jgi:hypothetical protein